MVIIYSYIDYRKYLKDALKEKREENEKYSHRYILNKMGINSTGYLANIISGKSSLSIEKSNIIGNIIGLSSVEKSYLKKLIYFSKAKTIDEKNDFFKEIMTYRKRKMALLDGNQLSLFSEWYIVVIREILLTYNFKDNYRELANLIVPRISVKDAVNAIKILEEIGLINIDESGYFKSVNRSISTGDEVDRFYVANFQRKMVNLAEFAIESTPSEERDISGITVSVTPEKFKLIKQEIQEFRKRIMFLAEDDDDLGKRVYRCNFNLFPLSKRLENNDAK